MEVSDSSDSKAGTSVDDLVPSSCFSEVINNLDPYENIIFDFDSCWADLEARLTVSKMVTDSIIKGMVNAVVAEANEKIALKEKEMRLLRLRLQSYEINSSEFNRLESLSSMYDYLEMDLSNEEKSDLENCCLHTNLVCAPTEQLHRLQTSMEEQFWKLGNEYYDFKSERFDAFRACLSAMFKQFNDLFLESCIKDLHTDFEAKLWEQKKHAYLLFKNQQKIIDGFSTWFQELYSLRKSFFTVEQGPALSPNNHDNDEWMGIKKKEHMVLKGLDNDNPIMTTPSKENGSILTEPAVNSPKSIQDVVEPPHLKDKSKEDVINYYKSVISTMRRQHDSALQEKTEEFYSFKRGLFKERGALPLRKDKELALMIKQIPDFLSKLDNILFESQNSPYFQDNVGLCCLKNRTDTLFSEYQCLQGLLRNKNREVMYLSSQMSDDIGQMSQQSSLAESFIRETDELKHQMEDMWIEASTKEELHKHMLKDFFEKQKHVFTDFLCDNKCHMEEVGLQSSFMQEVFSIIYNGAVQGAIDNLNSVTLKNHEERFFLEELLLEKNNLLCLEIEKNDNLRKEISSLMEEKKQNFASLVESSMQQQQLSVLDQHELIVLRNETNRQEIIITQQNMELSYVKSQMQEMLQKIYHYEEDLVVSNQKHKILWDSLDEAEKENTMLHSQVEENEKMLESSATREREYEKEMKCISNSVTGLSKTVNDFECNFSEVLGQHEFRLEVMNHQCKHLLQQANLFRKKGLLYKHMLELKCSNLRKAETEVDLLGDEVDALLSLLGNIYIALNHYAPVLQHYPGIMEILRLVHRELGGEK